MSTRRKRKRQQIKEKDRQIDRPTDKRTERRKIDRESVREYSSRSVLFCFVFIAVGNRTVQSICLKEKADLIQ